MRVLNEITVSSFVYLSVAHILKSVGSKYWWLVFVLMFLHLWDIYRDKEWRKKK